MKRLATAIMVMLSLPALADRVTVEEDDVLAVQVFESLEPCGEIIPPVNPDAPPTPSDLVIVPDISSMAVSWVSGGGTTDSFEVLSCEGPGCTNFGNSQTTSGTTASLTGLNEDTDYRVYVHALNSEGVSSNGIVGSAATGGLPTVPGRLLVAPVGNTLALAAVPSDDSTAFGYRWCEGSGCTSFGDPVTDQNDTFQILDLEWDTIYEVQARAENQWGVSGWTASESGQTAVDPDPSPTDPPTASPSLTITPGSTSVALSPTSIDPLATQYQFKICAGADCDFADQIARVYAAPYEKVFSGLTANTLYRAAGRAENAQGSGPWSSWAQFTTQEDSPPTSAPEVPNITADATDTTVTLTADNADQYTNYDFRLCEGAGCTSSDGYTRARDVDSPYTYTGLTAGTTYGYWGRAQNDVGNSNYTGYSFVTTTGGDPGPDPDPDPDPDIGGLCTDGVDCRCDLLEDAYGSDVVFCEDFEDPRLTEQGVWQKNPSSLQGAGWKGQGYTGITGACAFADDNGSVVPPGGASYGPAQIVNTDRCIELNHADRQSAIAGISEFQVFDGDVSMAQLNQPANAYPELPLVNGNPDYQTGGIHGTAQLDRPVKTFGVTRAVLTTSNVEETGVAWKDDQWTGNNFGIWGTVNPITPSSPPVQACTTPAGGWDMYPFAGTTWNWGGTKSTYTEVEGHGCDTGKLKHYPDPSTYTPPAPNTWVCQQFAYTDWGEDDMSFRYWQNGELIIDLQDIDATSAASGVNLSGMDQFNWNNYFNGATGDNANQGYEGTTYSGRLKDNVVVKEGEPVPCTEIGFDPEPEPPVAACTDGVDCLCDTIQGALFCEDFQDERLYSTTVDGNWVDNENQERGTANYWSEFYGAATPWLDDDQPVPNPNIGVTCDPRSNLCIASLEYCSPNQGNYDGASWGDDCWQNNSFDPVIDIQSTGDSGALIPGESDPTGVETQGRWMALSPNPTNASVIQGDASWNNQFNLGITMAYAFPTNVVSSGLLDNPWKFFEYGESNTAALSGFSSSPPGLYDGFPYQGFISPDDGTTSDAKASAVTPGTETGQIIGEIYGDSVRMRWRWDENDTSYRQSTDWPLGTWGCHKTRITGVNTTNTCITQWHGDEVVIDFCGMDTTNSNISGGLNGYAWNAYSNAWQTNPQNLTERSARYHDNIVITGGQPVSCETIGFD